MTSFPGESPEYRKARDELLEREIGSVAPRRNASSAARTISTFCSDIDLDLLDPLDAVVLPRLLPVPDPIVPPDASAMHRRVEQLVVVDLEVGTHQRRAAVPSQPTRREAPSS
jgi:hypothetical protein